MKIIFAGTPINAANILKHLIAAGHDVTAVLTREDAPVGRKRVLTESPVGQVANQLGIKVIKANSLTDSVLEQIKATGAELGIVVAYGVILKREALNAISFGWFNLHFSLLPKYRGAAPIQRSIANGDRESGITLFKLAEGLDTGDIVAQLPVLFAPDENSGEAIARFSELGSTLILEQLPRIYSGQATLKTQQGEVSLAPKPSRSEAKISFTEEAQKIENLIRAMNPEPMAWCFLDGQPFRIIEARASRMISDAHSIGEVFLSDSVFVACAGGTALELLTVQPSSKKVMSAIDWYRGASKSTILR